ncbi:protein of unknown function [Flavobacteriaceae bacterium MAR_2010_188]|nr:protein of unknown function [Flavobacteriaceae bacterium MAR_2010_188]
MIFTQEDKKQMDTKGLSEDKVLRQIELFKSGLPFSNLVDAANPDGGLVQLSDEKKEELISYFDEKMDSISIIKFVPASGAATRMFKFLFQFIKDYNPEKESINSYINNNKDRELNTFFVGLEKFPFYDIVMARLNKRFPDFENLNNNEQSLLFVQEMLDIDKLNYGNYPKGLLPFHEYKNKVISTAFEEHLFESALYSSKKRPTKLHFTISAKYKDSFKEEFKRIEDKVEGVTGSTYDITFSYQKNSTDTIAVTPNNEPFRNADNSLLFRPSGHGALIENLNELDADVIFMKNIDNVVVYKYKEQVAKHKKVLGGYLLKVQEKAFEYLKMLDEKINDEETLDPIVDFLSKDLYVNISKEFKKYKVKYQVEYLREKLNRPIRICGMVKNEGEPGGGPFWVKDENGVISLQIVESAQIDLKNEKQKRILKESTHFNPVDVICGVRDYQGNKFDLNKYVDPNAAFITMKTQSGKELKALELPGLWNGGMANWNTIFVEVPLITFNPVKTVNDLLKPAHQVR